MRTLNPVFHANDSPETAACAFTLGIQHPPGYPLPALLGKIFTFIPAGNEGFRVNIGAAFFAALAVLMLFFILVDTFKSGRENETAALAAAATASLCFAFSHTFWSEALSSKGGIYTLNAFLLLACVFALFKWQKTKQVKQLYLFSLVYGVSLANHWESMAVATPAFFVFALLVLAKDGFYKTLKFSNLVFMAALLFSGICIYAYLLIRSKTAWLNWGRPDTFAQLVQVILREQYADLEKARSLSVVANQADRIVKLMFSEFFAAGLMLAAAGFVAAMRTQKKERYLFFVVLAITILGALAFYFNLKEELLWIMDVFMIPVYVVMAVFGGTAIKWGMDFMAEGGSRKAELKGDGLRSEGGRKDSTIHPPPSALRLQSLTPIILAALLPALMLLGNWRKADQSRYFYAYDFGMNIIKSIEPPALALLDGDFNVMPQMYFKYVQKITQFCPVTTLFLYKPWGVLNQRAECPDVKFTSAPGDSFSSKLNNIVAQNYKERNIFVSVFRKSFEEFYPEGNRLLAPNGLVMKLTFDKIGTVRNAEVNLRKLSYRGLMGDGGYQNSTTKLCVSNYSSAYMETGNALKDAGDLKKAFVYMNRAVMLANEKTKAQSLTHLGILYSAAGDNETAIAKYKLAIAADKKLPEPYSNMSGIYNSMKKYDEAIAMAAEAMKQKPAFSEAYNNMAIAYYNKGDRKKAIELMEKAVEFSPRNELAKRNLAILKGEIK